MIIIGTDPICSCCGMMVGEADVQVVFVRDAFERGVTPPNAFAKACMVAAKRLMSHRKVISMSKIIYFCKTCLPVLPIGEPKS
jgi:hypothetical protein